jgi:hypothetical protein
MSQNEMLELQELRVKMKNTTIESNKVVSNVNEQSNRNKEYKIIAVKPSTNQSGGVKDDKLERLYKERESLLVTGMYTEKDPLIVNIDKMIRSLS